MAAAGGLLPVWSGWSSLPATMRVAVLAATPIVVAGLLHLVIASECRVSAVARVVDLLAGAAVAVHLAGYNAFADRHCSRTCAKVRPLAGSLLTTRSAVLWSTLLTIGASAVATVVIARRASSSRSITAAVLVAIVSVAVAATIRWSRYDDVSGPSELLVLVPPAAVAVVAATVCVAGARTWRTRIEVGRLVDRLSGSAAPVAQVAAVRSVQFAVHDEGRWVNPDGHDVEDGSPPNCLVINDGSGAAVRLVLTGRRDSADVLAALTPATRLALRNAQLAAVARARVADLQASRRRVVVAADAERRRIERDLHDGAQQRLVSATLHLAAAIARADPAEVETLARAEATTRDAMTRLRGITHGIFPSVLATEGLGVALDDLVGAANPPVTLRVAGDLDVGPDASMAAYATVAAALDARYHGVDAALATVSLARLNNTLTVTVDTDGDDPDPPDFTDVADRVGAMGGELSVACSANHILVTAVLPCVS